MDGDYDDIADLPDDGSRQMQTYARYGLAMYAAQVFEHGLVNAIVLSRQLHGQIPDLASWDTTFETQFRKATSDLARGVGRYGGLDDNDSSQLAQAVAERNRLAHRFFRDHVENSMSAIGMQRMLDDADQARELFVAADAIAERLCQEAIAQLGIAPTAQEEIIAEIRSRVYERDGG